MYIQILHFSSPRLNIQKQYSFPLIVIKPEIRNRRVMYKFFDVSRKAQKLFFLIKWIQVLRRYTSANVYQCFSLERALVIETHGSEKFHDAWTIVTKYSKQSANSRHDCDASFAEYFFQNLQFKSHILHYVKLRFPASIRKLA